MEVKKEVNEELPVKKNWETPRIVVLSENVIKGRGQPGTDGAGTDTAS
ncbi:hypothetical protein [Emticicia sp. TH156]|nr:hypothetical protein [Emticicia sp. TH156]